MPPDRRSTLVALLGVASSAVAQRGGADYPGRPSDPQEDVKLPNGKSQRDEILKADRDKNLKDAAELVELTQQLQQDIEKNDVFVFSISHSRRWTTLKSWSKRSAAACATISLLAAGVLRAQPKPAIVLPDPRDSATWQNGPWNLAGR